MPIMICGKCRKPCPDAFHDFPEICDCIDWLLMAEKMNWDLKFPENYRLLRKK